MDIYELKQKQMDELYQLALNVRRLETLEQALASYKQELASTQSTISNAGNKIVKLPTDHYEKAKSKVEQRIREDVEGRKRLIKMIFPICNLILGLVCALLLFLNSDRIGLFSAVSEVEGTIKYIPLFFTAILTAAAVIYSFAEVDWPPFFSIGGFCFYLFCVGAPIEAAAVCAMALQGIHPMLSGLVAAMVVLTLTGRVIAHRVNTGKIRIKPRAHTASERKTLKEAEKLDKDNSQKNAQRVADERNKVQGCYNYQVVDLKKKIEKTNAELAEVRYYIARNGILSKEDIPYAARLFELMESNRADTLKEALLLLDQERATRNMIAAENFYRRSAELDRRWQQWEEADRRDSARVAAQYQREKLEEKLDKIKRDVEFYNKYGWDKA